MENNGKTILVVDDEKDVTMYLTTLFEENGFTVMVAADGNEAMKAVESEKPDLITLDMSMPEKSGVRFYKELREKPETKGVPVVVVTAVTGKGGDPEPFKNFLSKRKQFPPPDAFIPKPFDKDELLATVNKLLG